MSVQTGTRVRLAELLRQPLTLLALFVLPPVVIEVYGVAAGSFPQLPTSASEPATLGRLTGAVFAVAFLAALVGLFQIVSARDGDRRLAIAGLAPTTLLATRLATTLLVGIGGAVVALLTISLRVDVAAPAIAAGALVLAGSIYGLLGIVVGAVLPRELDGSLVLVFLADFDTVVSSGLVPVAGSVSLPVVGEVTVTDVAPLAHPHELFRTAVLDGTLADGHLVAALGWVAALLAVAVLAYTHSTGAGWSA
ncbi:ABC transporter permease [Halovenus halobia]|uniref:ABC transporter permease n=1 Tax=Halovenus halobia TaxID=3396622 RepID=UPI003F56069B